MAAPVYWAYACHAEAAGRWARGFVLATSKQEAVSKARKHVTKERRRVAKGFNMKAADIGPLPSRGVHALRVWRDPERATAPQARHYTERRTA